MIRRSLRIFAQCTRRNNVNMQWTARRALMDRSFRLANVSDLYVAQDYADRIHHEHYSLYASSDLTPRDMSKQLVIDLSHEQGYRRGHIKGAVNLSVDHFDFTRPVDTYGGITQDEVYHTFKNMGISNETSEVILYDNSGMLACRLWFVLRYFGFSNVRILNGGWRAWLKAGLPITEEDSKPVPASSLDLKAKRTSLLTKPTSMVFDHQHQTSKYVDTRRHAAYKVYHMEGAVNIPSTDIMEDAQFQSVKVLRETADHAGLELDEDKVIVYSSKSLSSSVGLFALSMIGGEHVSLYDAGINNWRQNFDYRLPLDVEEHLQR